MSSVSTLAARVLFPLVAALPALHAQTAAPAGLSVAPSDQSQRVTLRWDPVAGATGYRVQRAASPGSTPVTLAASTSLTAYTDTTAAPGSVYYYTVTALASAGNSPASGTYASPGVILDNLNPGASSTEISYTGAWSSSGVAGSHGTPSLFAGSTSGAASATYTYTTRLPARGTYEVYGRWTAHENRAASTPVDIRFDSCSEDNGNPAGAWSSGSKGARTLSVTLDQQQNGGQWVRLGVAVCNGLDRVTVIVGNNTGTEGKNVVADAFQFVPQTINPSPYSVSLLSDDFDALDSDRWKIWSGRGNVSVANGELILTQRIKNASLVDAGGYIVKDESNWTTGGIHAPAHAQKYGYYEIRYRTTQHHGVDNAFWMLTSQACAYDSMELDVPEVWTKGYGYGTAHGSGMGSWRFLDPVNPSSRDDAALRLWPDKYTHAYDGTDWTQYHTYGVEWLTDDTVVYYMDGIERWRSPNLPAEPGSMDKISTFAPLFPIISTLPMNWMGIDPGAAPGALPPLHGKTMNVDYVRLAQKPGWIGSSGGAWNQLSSWGPDGVPTARTAAVFNQPAAAATIAIPAGQAARSLYLDNHGLPSLTFNGGPLKLGHVSPSIGGVLVTPQVATSQTINAAIEAQTHLQFANYASDSTATLALNGPISSAAPGYSIHFNTPKRIDVSGLIDSSVTRIHKAGIGALHLRGEHAFSGAFTIEKGFVYADSLADGGQPSSLGASSSSAANFGFVGVYKSTDYRPRLIYVGDDAASINRGITLGGSAVEGGLESSGAGRLVWNGSLVLAPETLVGRAPHTNALFVLGGTHAGANTFAGRLADTQTGIPLALEKTGPGSWTLTGDNSARAGLRVLGGTLVLGSGTSGSLACPTITVGWGSTFVIDRDDALAVSAHIAGSGAVRKRGAGLVTLSGVNTFAGGTTVEAGSLNLAATGALAGPVTILGGVFVVHTGATATTSTTVQTGGAFHNWGTHTGGVSVLSGGGLRNRGTITGNVSVGSGAVADAVGIIQGNLTNAGVITLSGATPFSVSGTITNTGVIDARDWIGTLPAHIVNSGGGTVIAPVATTLALDVPSGGVKVLRASAKSLSLATTASGVAPVSVTWTQVSGPAGANAVFANASVADTSVSFSAPGLYVLRATATDARPDRAVSVDVSVIANFYQDVVLRAGPGGYDHVATFLRSDSPDWNSGARDQMLVGRYNGMLRPVFSFPLTGLPPRPAFASASLDLWTFGGSGPYVSNLELHALAGPFLEGAGDGSSAGSGAGTGATWLDRAPGENWTSPGGDILSPALASVAGFPATETGTLKSFSGLGLTDRVQLVSDAGQPLDLRLSAPATESGPTNQFARLVSDDNADTAKRPRLTLKLTPGVGSPWTGTDIGTTGGLGDASELGAGVSRTYAVTGAGENIGGNFDAFHFVHQPAGASDQACEIIARVAAQEPVDPNAKAGLMIRASAYAGSANVFFGVTPSGLVFHRRELSGAATTHATGSPFALSGAPRWLKLSRSGDAYTASTSVDGSAWTPLGTLSVPGLPSAALIGMAVTSRVPGITSTAAFDRLEIAP